MTHPELSSAPDTTGYLVAAEADHIQEMIFQAAQLREVVGGSQLLAHFCEKVVPDLVAAEFPNAVDLIVNDGGTFRAKCRDLAAANRFSIRLRETFYQRLGASLTVAIADDGYDANTFAQAHTTVCDALRRAKASRHRSSTTQQMPYSAMCASCGTAVAQYFRAPDEFEAKLEDPADEQTRATQKYLCPQCFEKAQFRGDKQDWFLRHFESTLNDQSGHRKCVRKSEDLASLDSHRFVAYMKADGNGFGTWFSDCVTGKELCDLSKGMHEAVWDSLAEATRPLIERVKEVDAGFKGIPALPLIVGGDDVFMMLPARWCVDFARLFAKELERGLMALQQKLGHNRPRPTVSVALVVCKSGYPHQLANQRASRLLKETKRHAKTRAEPMSALSFQVVSGNALAIDSDEQDGEFRPTLQPYALTECSDEDTEQIGTLLNARAILDRDSRDELPSRRRQQLRELYARSATIDGQSDRDDWQADFQSLISRLQAVSGSDVETPGHFGSLTNVLRRLGGAGIAGGAWRRVRRVGEHDFKAHGILELFNAWRFLERLDSASDDEKTRERDEQIEDTQ